MRKPRELRVADRCDHGSCSAQAWVVAAFLKGDLFFCRHHYLKHKDEIDRQALVVQDESHKINEKSQSSA